MVIHPGRPLSSQFRRCLADRGCDPDPEWKERILRGMTLVAMFDGEPDSEILSLLDAAAEAFGVDARPVKTYRNVMLDRQMIVRFDIARRGFLRQTIEATVRDGGLPAFASTLKVLSGHEDRSMLERFQTLRGYPPGSFGKAYADFIERNENLDLYVDPKTGIEAEEPKKKPTRRYFK